jgi:high affinity Mn2+ porin
MLRPPTIRHLLPAGLALCAGTATTAEPEDWNLGLQSTYVRQLKPALESPYAGPNSLKGEREWSYSFIATAALGLRLGPATEAYFDPEVAQGVAPSGLVGLAGFPNGELARTAGPDPTLYRARLFVRHVIGLSDALEPVEPAMNQLGANYATRRLVLTAGNLSVLDIFDANAYAHDPSTQFLNWALMTHAAYDYAADARGYTWGFAAEYVTERWALRFGRFAQPREPNGSELDPHLLDHFGDQVEVERRYDLGADRPGSARLLAFRNRAVMARYDDALALADATGSTPDLNAVRHGEQVKFGIGVNLEQQVSKHAGMFARGLWADGKTETYAFTEADRSLSAGLSLDGAAWGRGGDVAALALAQNLLSGPHREYLERGGLTFFLGDGALNYRPERIVEAYYLWSPVKGIGLSLDWQRIANPGYNADRGPATFWGVRLHAEN